MVAAVMPFHPATDQNKINDRLLHAAADDTAALHRALAEGAQINARGEDGETALIRAAREGRLENAHILVQANASLDLQDRHGRTALFYATHMAHVTMASLLIDAGADITLDDKDGIKPLDIALRNGAPELVSLFEQPLKNLLARIPSADTGARLQYRAAPSCPPDPHGDTMLTWAAREGQENVIRAMVQSGADVRLRNRAGQTPRDVADAAGHHHIVHLLEEAEAHLPVSRAADTAAADMNYPPPVQ